MVSSCCIIGCTNRGGKGGVKLFPFPRVRHNEGDMVRELSEHRLRMWVRAVNRKKITIDSIKNFHMICEEHFINGRPASYMQENDPSWVPSLKLGYDEDEEGASAKDTATPYRPLKRSKEKGHEKSEMMAADSLISLSKKHETKVHVQEVAINNTSNMMVAAMNQVLVQKTVRDFAHSLNLVVQESIKKDCGVNKMRRKIKDILSYFHHSAEANDRLQETLKSHGKGDMKELVQDVDTSWNSTVTMLKRYNEHHEAVTTTLRLHSKHDMCVGNEDLVLINKVVQALEYFQIVMEEISSESKAPLSKLIPYVKLLPKCLSIISTDVSIVAKLQEELRNKFSDIEDYFMTCAATYLDPRFKTLYITDRLALERMHVRIRGMLAYAHSKEKAAILKGEETEDVQGTITEPPLKKRSFWYNHDKRVRELLTKNPRISGPDLELKRYAERAIIRRTEDPLNWWKTNRDLLPHLSQIALQFLDIPAASASTEGLVSNVGALLSDRSDLKDSLEVTDLDQKC